MFNIYRVNCWCFTGSISTLLYAPLTAFLSVFVLVSLLLILLNLVSYVWKRYRYDEAAAVADSIGDAAAKATQRKRLRSLDTFRG